MKKHMYDALYTVEDHLWWFTGLRKLYAYLLADVKDILILDAGCGTGANLTFLKPYGNSLSPLGIDISDDALAYNIKRGNQGRVMKADMNSLPFKNASFDLVLASDSLYHLRVDDTTVLREFHRILKKDGQLIMNTASYQILKSRHDIHGMTKQRYTRKSLQCLLTTAGFHVEQLFYWNSLLFPLRALQIFLEKISALFAFSTRENGNTETSAFTVNNITNKILTGIITSEVALLTHGFRFPFGLSIMCKVRKQ